MNRFCPNIPTANIIDAAPRSTYHLLRKCIDICGKYLTERVGYDGAEAMTRMPCSRGRVQTAEGWVRDVTEDIAQAVVNRARSEHRALGAVAQTFVETALEAENLVLR